jgi:hypothetical protein
MSAKSPLNLAALAHARAVRFGTPADVSATRTALAEAKIEAFIEKTLATAPDLRDDQRARLARLLLADGSER